jgi:hypothetical protein
MKKFLLLLLACGILLGADRPIFEFHSSFWVNLHHFLYEQALAKEPVASDSKDWRAAVDYYRTKVVKHDLLTDEMGRVNQSLAESENAQSLQGSTVPPEWIAVLKSAAPVYRAQWWPEHNRGNLAWIEAAKPLVAKYGPVLTKEVAATYQTEWPSDPIRVDVAEYASWAGAYTMRDPTHITMSSTNPIYRGDAVVEMLFHESSHAIDDKVREALEAEAASQKKVFRRRGFSHAVLFYTAGELARRHLEGYTQVGIKEGILERGWPGALPVIEQDWKPYLDGKIDLATAVRRMVADYGVPRNTTP